MADGSTVIAAPKLCKDCKHFRRDWSWLNGWAFPVIGWILSLFTLRSDA